MKSRKLASMLLSALACAAIAFSLAVRAQAQTESVLYSFSGAADGALPNGGLISDGAGNLYGTAFAGGDLSVCGGGGCGVVYKLSPSSNGWTETVLHTFSGGDGANPSAGLIFDAKGNLYGTTSAGGRFTCQGDGCGVIFQLSPTSSGWKEKVLYNFGGTSDGSAPTFPLTFDAAGNLYGVAQSGGNTTNCSGFSYGCGVAFKLWHESSGWSFQALYVFSDADSSGPASGFLLDARGNLFGTGTYASGVVYELSPTASKTWKDIVIYYFTEPIGYSPQGLVFDAEGNLYGPTVYGGTGGGIIDCEDKQPGCGTVFKLSRGSGGWTESALHEFTGADASPLGSLVFDAADNLYGTDSVEVFELSRGSNGGWTKTALHTFAGAGDGKDPRGSLLLDKADDIFGVTLAGGFSGAGTVFEIAP
jgi:uncharacterized repeat protein (TIGR03803 family)